MKLKLENGLGYKANICEDIKYPKEKDIITIKDEYCEYKAKVIKINEGNNPWETTLTIERINQLK